jgi:RNA recognition motif-containing protein
MRQSGEVIRADVGMAPDGSPKGTGTVTFMNPADAQAAIRELRLDVVSRVAIAERS